ncbi:MAG: hypothetical protein COT74_05020 [Bdellovibrionales bacterium CG10_big_fil_rev_8_21_14_0_10_45_34]|nr:MAG: hypothetical protein COT74_05020 [Bdellovibrionales bacterium CG10_big_fil_rev_8_21_14_0_10_45_34]
MTDPKVTHSSQSLTVRSISEPAGTHVMNEWAIIANDISKRFGDFQALKPCSVKVRKGEVLGLLGENGAGKSTLLKCLFGLYKSDSGSLFIKGERAFPINPMKAKNFGVGLLEQHFSLVENLTVYENILLSGAPTSAIGVFDKDAILNDVRKVLPSASFELNPDLFVRDLSVGQKQRLEIVKLLYGGADILFLDEPTAVLSPSEKTEFFSVLKQLKLSGKTIVIVTHKVAEVFSVCDSYAVLRKGELVKTGQIADSKESDVVSLLMGEMKAASLSEKPIQSPNLEVQSDLPNNLLSLKLSAENAFSQSNLSQLELELNAGEIIGIAGVEGSGQSLLVNVLLGLEPYTGSAKIMGEEICKLSTKEIRNLGVGFIAQDRHSQSLWCQESVYINTVVGLPTTYTPRGLVDFARPYDEAIASLKEMSVAYPSLSTQIVSMSGGNQQKLVFAREALLRKPKLLICHQPTRGVDLKSTEHIHELLRAHALAGGASLLFSADLEELFSLCHKIHVIYSGSLSVALTPPYNVNTIGQLMTGVKE